MAQENGLNKILTYRFVLYRIVDFVTRKSKQSNEGTFTEQIYSCRKFLHFLSELQSWARIKLAFNDWMKFISDGVGKR